MFTDYHSILARWRNHISQLFNPLNAELNPICHLLALLGAHHILHISRIRVNIHGLMMLGRRKYTAEPLVPELCAFEVELAIEKLKSHK